MRGSTGGSADLVLSEVCGFSGGNMGRAADLRSGGARYPLCGSCAYHSRVCALSKMGLRPKAAELETHKLCVAPPEYSGMSAEESVSPSAGGSATAGRFDCRPR